MLAAVFALPAFVSLSALAEPVRAALPGWVAPAARAAAAVVFCYLAAGAVLTGFALVIHHGRVTAVSAELGSSWAAVPIVLLQVLTVPNAAVAGGAYLAGPGFALGTGDHVSALTTGHGLLPAFPILGAAPTGHGATWPVWVLMSLTALLAATAAARTAWRSPSPWPVLGGAAALATLGGSVLAWQSGGGIGSGRLGAIGASPWQLGLAWGAVTAVGGGVALVFAIVARSLRQRDEQHMPAVVRVAVEAVTSVTSAVSAIVEADQAPVAEQQPTAEPIAEREERRAG